MNFQFFTFFLGIIQIQEIYSQGLPSCTSQCLATCNLAKNPKETEEEAADTGNYGAYDSKPVGLKGFAEAIEEMLKHSNWVKDVQNSIQENENADKFMDEYLFE